MAPDDRDRNLEKALARHFRASFKAGMEPPLAAAPSSSACPDAETLAAYHDGTLSAEERNVWKQHVLACEGCQLVLEHLATPLDVPVAAETHDAVAAAIPFREAAPAQAPVAASSPASVPVIRFRKRYFAWLVPTGAIAAGLLTWVVIHESGSLPRLGSERLEVADNRQAAPTAPPVSAPAPSASASQPKRIEAAPSSDDLSGREQFDLKTAPPQPQKQSAAKDEPDAKGALGGVIAGSTGAADARDQRSADQELRRRVEPTQQAANRKVPVAHGPALSAQQQQAQQMLQSLDAQSAEKKAEADKGKQLPKEAGSYAAKAAPAPPPALADESSAFVDSNALTAAPPKVAHAAGAPSAAGKAKSAAPAQAPEVGVATETVEVRPYASSLTLLSAVAALQGPSTFGDSAGKALWRVGPAGSLEFSADNGANWSTQASGITTDLLTGSAPSAKVCWVVGNSGMILRTIDAGNHWIKISSPARADLIGVNATDAFHATVWFVADPRTAALQTYKTSDGGITWSLVPSH